MENATKESYSKSTDAVGVTETEEDFMKKVRKDVKNISKPYVMKDDKGTLYIIYKNRCERYVLDRTETKKQIDKENEDCGFEYEEIYGKGWNKEHERVVLEGCGFHQVGLKDEEVTQ